MVALISPEGSQCEVGGDDLVSSLLASGWRRVEREPVRGERRPVRTKKAEQN